MFDKILIANRGEIAVRIIRSCQELGVRTVAVYSTADDDALHAQIADEAICIGPPAVKDSYLNAANIISAALLTGAQAIHPGFGFLSESPDFVSLCNKNNLVFIGPPAEAMVLMGDKANARETMRRAGVPVVPGSDGLIDDAAAALAYAETIGYPVMIKASSGGGGRGIRKVDKAENMEQAFQAATTEALACFGNGRVYIEKYLGDPRHIEVQILADNYGNVVHLGERDCSLQRKNQKMIEEAPAYFLDKETREKMGQAAVNAAKSVGYRNAGTIEFLVDNDKNFYFMEMNTRIQVEHPVTEMITGVDLVQQQIKIAAGEPIGFSQKDVHCRGHAIECRICAEDPYKHFAPCPGKIVALHMSGGPGVRIDSAVYQDYSIPSHYDSMIAKVIVHAPTRDEAIRRMRRALAETVIEGIMTNVDYHLEILRQEEYLSGDVDIGFLGRMDALFGSGSKSS